MLIFLTEICSLRSKFQRNMAKIKKEKKKNEVDFLHTPRGMYDILPDEILLREKLRYIAASVAEFYGFRMIETPVLEHEELFTRGIGRQTQIVEKEMYCFRTKGGDRLALRPEATAGICRAYIQHGMANLPSPVKLWYWGPMFRHDAPQRGRLRQFWQAGLEYFGEEHAAVDAELIQATVKILEAFGIKNLRIEVNSVGCGQCRALYKTALKAYYRSRVRRLCADCKKRIRENPLRLLGCRNEICVLIKKDAPEITERLCGTCRDHFKKLLEFLDDLGYPYLLNPHLVRGLDYYNRTIFEIFPESTLVATHHGVNMSRAPNPLEGLAIAGGGRFDYLVEMLGGPKTPAVGSAIGVERAIAVLAEIGAKFPERPGQRVFLVQLGELAKKQSLKLLEEFRKADIKLAASLGRDSIKAQMKVADRIGAHIALIIGQKEAIDETIIMRDMQSGSQETIPVSKIVDAVKDKLNKI